MKRAASRAYLNTEVATAEGGQMILRLYDKALSCITLGMEAIERGDQDVKSQHLSRAIDIVCELMASLDFDHQPIADNLYQLYSYMYRRLMEGSLHSDAKAAGEVLKMLQGLRSSWKVAVGNGSSAKAAGGDPSSLNGTRPGPKGAFTA